VTEETFDEILLAAVDESLSSLGQSVKQAVFFHLENKFKVPRSEIPKRIGDFANGIEKIFGLGAQFLEILIMKKLYEKIGQPLQWSKTKEFAFVDYVETARRNYVTKKKDK
jgi:hypothetical protein